jgi:hypothetical protein
VKGKFYVFAGARGTTFTHTQTAVKSADDGAIGDGFGSSVAIAGAAPVIVSCAPSAVVNTLERAGACYVFTASSVTSTPWTQVQKLVAVTPVTNAYLGYGGKSVSINAAGTIIAAGAPYDASSVTSAGSLYVYTATSSSWSSYTVAKLSPTSTTSGQLFGTAIAMNAAGTIIAVGASADTVSSASDGGVRAGRVSIYTSSGGAFTPTSVLTAPDAVSYDTFGTSIGLSASGTTLVIGAPTSWSSSTTKVGKAYTYNLVSGTYTLESYRLAPTTYAESFFGSSAVLSADGLNVFAAGKGGRVLDADAKAGAVYAFTRGGFASNTATVSVCASRSSTTQPAAALRVHRC